MHGNLSLSDNELILKAQQGSLEAFEELVQRHDKRVMSIALTYTRNVDDAKDIYQEAFIRVYKALSKFSFRSEFSTWMYRIVTNVCLTYHSQRKKYQFTTIDEHRDDEQRTAYAVPIAVEPQQDQHVINSEISMKIHQSMESLSPQQKMVFTMKHMQGYKIREIASMMNCTDGTVKKHLFTACERMRKQLKDLM